MGATSAITINNEDEQFLLDMKNKMDYKGNLDYQNKVNAIEYRFSSKQIKKDLAKYSIVPRKTYIGITIIIVPLCYSSRSFGFIIIRMS